VKISSSNHPRIARFAEIGDYYDLVIVEDPKWIDDPSNPGNEILEVIGQDDRDIYWRILARTQMPDAIFDAVAEAGADEILRGSRLRVEFIELRGNTKIYKATYKPSAGSDSEAPF
jgi:hypothetical protein